MHAFCAVLLFAALPLFECFSLSPCATKICPTFQQHASVKLLFRVSKSKLNSGCVSTLGSVDTEKQNFDLNRGEAVNALLHDYPTIFSHSCDFSVFTEDIVLEDVQGFRIEGLRKYKTFFTILSTIINVCFSKYFTSVILMDKYACDKSRIRLRWRIDLYSRLSGSLTDIFRWIDSDGNGVISSDEYSAIKRHVFEKPSAQGEPFVIDGVSVYKLDSKGRIYHHSIEIQSPISPSLAPLRELLAVKSGPAMIPSSNFYFNTIPIRTSVTARVAGLPSGSNLTADMLTSNIDNMNSKAKSTPFEISSPLKSFLKKLPKQCKSDFDCNPGGFNMPLRCVDFVIARFCIDPDDWTGGGLGALAWDPTMALEPIPVRIEDGYQ